MKGERIKRFHSGRAMPDSDFYIIPGDCVLIDQPDLIEGQGSQGHCHRFGGLFRSRLTGAAAKCIGNELEIECSVRKLAPDFYGNPIQHDGVDVDVIMKQTPHPEIDKNAPGRQQGVPLTVFHVNIAQLDLPGKTDTQFTDADPGLELAGQICFRLPAYDILHIRGLHQEDQDDQESKKKEKYL